MKIIKETGYRVVQMMGYSGVCHACNTPLEYDGVLVVVIVSRLPDRDIVVPVDRISCPYCSKTIQVMEIYNSLEVTEEMRK